MLVLLVLVVSGIGLHIRGSHCCYQKGKFHREGVVCDAELSYRELRNDANYADCSSSKLTIRLKERETAVNDNGQLDSVRCMVSRDRRGKKTFQKFGHTQWRTSVSYE